MLSQLADLFRTLATGFVAIRAFKGPVTSLYSQCATHTSVDGQSQTMRSRAVSHGGSALVHRRDAAIWTMSIVNKLAGAPLTLM